MKILVFDGRQRAALACTRSLGAAGHEVVVADESPKTLAGASKYCTSELIHPSPDNSCDFVEWLAEVVETQAFDCLMPITEISTDLVMRHRSRWPSVRLPFANIERIDSISNKVALFELASGLGLPFPKTQIVTSANALEAAAQQTGFPCILKPARSRVLVGSEWHSTSVQRIENTQDLASVLEDIPKHYFPALLQEFVAGKGAGFFALCEDGEIKACFSHRRLREKPPEGGVSVLSESVYPDPKILDYSKKLLAANKWSGPCMVEYRVSASGVPYLMEVNARFWGSLQLAIDAGVDFPRLLLDTELLQAQDIQARYREGVVLRWFFGDLDRLYLQYKDRKNRSIKFLLFECFRFLGASASTAKNEIFRLDDPGPGLREFKQYFS